MMHNHAANETEALAQFLTQHGTGPDALHRLTYALARLCREGGGSWLEPQDGATRQPTHLVEISAFHINAAGMTVDQAVLNWRKIAFQSLAQPQPPATGYAL